MDTTLVSPWERVLARDANATFFYSVRSTGIYCRPACPSRRPNRANVEFWESTQAAEAAGFRACRRCRPGGASGDVRHAALVEAACRTIARSDEPPSLETLARDAGLSRFHFARTFKRVTGTTPKAYAIALRSHRVRGALETGTSVTQAFHDAGYGSSTRFYERARTELGMAPATFRDGGNGERIRFAIAPSSLGNVLVAATDYGLCDVAIGDDAGALEASLRARFAAATFVGADDAFTLMARDVVSAVDASAVRSALPLDVRGTAFQDRVWRALCDIPAGETRSYAQIAQSLGMPRGARAVARACAQNRVAVVVPCHRAVGSDGALRGYRWGIARKRALLERERGARD